MMNLKTDEIRATSADLTGLLLILEYAAEQASMLALPSTARLINQALWSIEPKLAVAHEQENAGPDDLESGRSDASAARQWRCQ